MSQHVFELRSVWLTLDFSHGGPFVAPAADGRKFLLGLWDCWGQPEPQAYRSFDGREMRTSEFAELSNQFRVRNGDKILRVEHSWA